MHLLRFDASGEIKLETDLFGTAIPRYAILSHTWGHDGDEVTFRDILNGQGNSKPGMEKVRGFGEQAKLNGLEYFWVDTCCIDKTNSAELSEAINSMFTWYRNATVCYAYLSDVPSDQGLKVETSDEKSKKAFICSSRWFKRGWTLQELLAPSTVKFFARDWTCLGSRLSLIEEIGECTGIPISALEGRALSKFTFNERISWQKNRETTREEDKVYSLLGICEVFLPLIYGEGEVHAFDRLRRQISEKDRRHIISNWLCSSDYSLQQMDVSRRHQPGTGRWFLTDPRFKDWVNGDQRMLVCPGQPGAGKTVLTSLVINHLMREFSPSDAPVLYIFFDYARQNEQTAEHLARTLLRQFILASAVVPEIVVKMYEEHIRQNTQALFEEVVIGLQECVKSVSDVFVVIDALDECSNEARVITLTFLRRLSKLGNLRLLVTSRPSTDLSELGSQESNLQIYASEVDVKLYIESRLSELSIVVRKDVQLQERVVTTITSATEGMFLLTTLYMNLLKHKRTVSSVKTALDSLPSGSDVYNTLYDEAMERICGQVDEDKDLALQTIAWIALSRRPLRPDELRHALAIKPLSQDLDDDDVPDVDEVLSLCAGLITRDIDCKTVRLVHYTTDDYLQRKLSYWYQNAQRNLALKCITYINYNHFASGICRNLKAYKELNIRYPLYAYATKYWSSHFRAYERAAGDDADDDLQNFALEMVCDEALVNSAYQARLTGLYTNESLVQTPHISGVHFTVVTDTLRLLSLLLDKQPTAASSRDSDGLTPLIYACQADNVEAVKVLLNTADGIGTIEVRAEDGKSALQHAAARGCTPIVVLLLQHYSGAAPGVLKDESTGPASTGFSSSPSEGGSLSTLASTTTDDICSALALAVQFKHIEVMKLLIKGRNPNELLARSGYEILRMAALHDDFEIMSLLVESHERNIHLTRDARRYALSTAIFFDHMSATKALLENDANILYIPQDGTQDFLLHLAAAYAQAPIMELLLTARGVNINAKVLTDRLPLYEAIARGRFEAAAQIQSRLAILETDPKSIFESTMLHVAIDEINAPVAQAIISTGQANVNARDQLQRTPLHIAVELEFETPVRLLLNGGLTDGDLLQPINPGGISEHDARRIARARCIADNLDLDSRDRNGRSPLILAAAENDEDSIMRMLLSSGRVDVNLRDDNGRTALIEATIRARLDMMKLLLETGQVEIDAIDSSGKSALAYAEEQEDSAKIIELIMAYKNPKTGKRKLSADLSRSVKPRQE